MRTRTRVTMSSSTNNPPYEILDSHSIFQLNLGSVTPESMPQMIDLNLTSLSTWLYTSEVPANVRSFSIKAHNERVENNANEYRLCVFRPWADETIVELGTQNEKDKEARSPDGRLGDAITASNRVYGSNNPRNVDELRAGQMLATVKWRFETIDPGAATWTDLNREWGPSMNKSELVQVFEIVEAARDFAMTGETRYWHLSRYFIWPKHWSGWKSAGDSAPDRYHYAAEVTRMLVRWATSQADKHGHKCFATPEEEWIEFWEGEGFKRWDHHGLGKGIDKTSDTDKGVLRVELPGGRAWRRVAMIREPIKE